MDAVPLDVPLAGRVAAGLVPLGPARSPQDVASMIAGLHAAAEASVEHVARVSGLPLPTDDVPTRVVDRVSWVAANVAMARVLLDAAAAAEPPAPAHAIRPRWSRAAARAEGWANGVQAAALFSALSGRILGQYLPFGRPQLLLVGLNVARMETQLGVRPADFRLWVCLHEQTHRLQFAAAPWLRDHLVRCLVEVLDDAPGPRVPRPRASVLDLIVTPGQRHGLDRVSAVMSLLEGYADVMMDRVGPGVVPSVATIRQRFEARRRGDGMTVLARLAGLNVKLAQYRDGAAFCRGVIGAVGVDGLNAVYSGPEALPTFAEIHDPAAWVARVHGVRA